MSCTKDMPLIEIDQDKLLFMPSVIKNGKISVTVESIISQWNEGLFTKRGLIMEKELGETLTEYLTEKKLLILRKSMSIMRCLNLMLSYL